MKRILLIAGLVIVFISGAVAIRSREDTWICQNGSWVKHGNPGSQIPNRACGTVPTKTQKPKPDKIKDMLINSSAFETQQKIPKIYTCDGEGINPPLEFNEVPINTKSLALIVDDPDAPSGDWVHWTIWNINPDVKRIEEDKIPENAIQGMTSFGKIGYGAPCPPSGTHRYFFRLYALDMTLDLPITTKKQELLQDMEGHILGQAELVGLYR